MSKKIDDTLIPRYGGKCAIEYERIQSTIRKTRLYKFIQVPYIQPLLKTTASLSNLIPPGFISK
jgi:hypothetical protein